MDIEPIDVVIPWVNGDDPEWQARKTATLADSYKNRWLYTDPSSRYRNWRCIELCLTSIVVNADWVRQIVLVTQNQTPACLAAVENFNSRRIPIRVVSHDQFIPENYLPTFNILAICSFFHRIPDLSKRFLYVEDDMCFLRQLQRSSYVSDQGKICMTPDAVVEDELKRIRLASRQMKQGDFASSKDLVRELAVVLQDYPKHWPSMLRRTRKLARDVYSGDKSIKQTSHFPTMFFKDDLAFVESRFPEQIEQCRQNKVRSRYDVEVLLLASNRALERGDVEFVKRDQFFLEIRDNPIPLKETLEQAASRDIVCLNDNCTLADDHPNFAQIERLISEFVDSQLKRMGKSLGNTNYAPITEADRMRNVVRNTDVRTTILPDGFVALFERDTQRIGTLPPFAALVWEFCDGEHSINQIVEEVTAWMQESDVQPPSETEISELIEQLIQEGFLHLA